MPPKLVVIGKFFSIGVITGIPNREISIPIDDQATVEIFISSIILYVEILSSGQINSTFLKFFELYFL